MIKKVVRKSMTIRPSGRSTDYISPSFGHGCLYNCSYCYMKRHKASGLDIATNTEAILTEINSHAYFADVEKPNQTHEQFITYDISCNEDFALHAKYHQWEKIFNYFKGDTPAMASFATKYVNKDLLKFDPLGKVRIRFSLLPEVWHPILEPNTSTIDERLEAVGKFLEAGYEVHLNFSPVVVHDKWLVHYKELFLKVREYAARDHWNDPRVKAEVIFLTHNKEKHRFNLENNITGEELLWKPEMQESKISQYGGSNIRYTASEKQLFISSWQDLHDLILPWNTIRYIF